MTMLVNVNDMSTAQLDILYQQIMAKKTELLQLEVEKIKDDLAKMAVSQEIKQQEMEVMKHRLDNIDCTNIDGDTRDRLNRMIRLYASKKGIYFNKAYREFVQAFNTAYRTNLELKMTNYCRNRGKKEISTPEYLQQCGLLEDAIRVADKMLNPRRAG